MAATKKQKTSVSKKKTKVAATKKQAARPAAKPKKKASSKKATAAKKVEPKKKVSSAKAPAPDATPKMSPLRGVSVDDWAKKLTGWQSDALKLIRAMVVRHAPLATLEMKWGQPVWEHNGPFAYARPSTKHLTFGFWRGADLSDPSSVLEGGGDRMRHVKITSIEDISRLPLEEFIKEAVDLNEKKGNPTTRKSPEPSAQAAEARRAARAASSPRPPQKSRLHRHGQDR